MGELVLAWCGPSISMTNVSVAKVLKQCTCSNTCRESSVCTFPLQTCAWKLFRHVFSIYMALRLALQHVLKFVLSATFKKLVDVCHKDSACRMQQG